MSLTETAAKLNEAADEVAAGWCQGRLNDEDGNCCVLGAIYRVAPGSSLRNLRFEMLGALRKHLGRGVRADHWNDADGRTADEVESALRSAAELVSA